MRKLSGFTQESLKGKFILNNFNPICSGPGAADGFFHFYLIFSLYCFGLAGEFFELGETRESSRKTSRGRLQCQDRVRERREITNPGVLARDTLVRYCLKQVPRAGQKGRRVGVSKSNFKKGFQAFREDNLRGFEMGKREE